MAGYDGQFEQEDGENSRSVLFFMEQKKECPGRIADRSTGNP